MAARNSVCASLKSDLLEKKAIIHHLGFSYYSSVFKVAVQGKDNRGTFEGAFGIEHLP
ncbi:hypothetical protein [Enterococcus sp. AD013-P3]|uniref:hypothetical protein n=1 Tax=Enterococcus sp. AD013-P3 TaxID=3411036 RepID=UPI003B95E60E